MSFKKQLEEVWVKEREYLSEIDPNNQKDLYKAQAERVNAIEKQLTDLEKTENELSEKVASREVDAQLRLEQLESDNKDHKARNRVEWAKVIVPVVGAFTMGLISMKWEKVDTLTSTAGKSSLRDILRFK